MKSADSLGDADLAEEEMWGSNEWVKRQRQGRAFTVGCDRCGGNYPWMDWQLAREGHEPRVNSWVNFCDNAGCNGQIFVNQEITGTMVIEDESRCAI